jgi:predicted amidohydrolase YtcJ
MRAPAGRVLLRNAVITAASSESAESRPTAMLVEGGQIVWLGDDAPDAAHAVRADAQTVDLAGRLVTPGFVDAHVHLAATGFALVSADLSAAGSVDQALELLAEAAREADEGALLTAHGWDETRWPDRRWPTRSEIDAVVGRRPAYVSRVDSHSAIVSTALVDRAPGIARSAGWSDDGRVERDAHHVARGAVDGLRTTDDRRVAIARALDCAASVGVTTVHELNAPHIAPYSDFDLVDEMLAAGGVPLVERYWGSPLGDHVDPRLAGHAGDYCADGAVGSRTAAMASPYADADTSGHLYLDSAQIREHVVACTRAGVQAGFHVIGERALGEVTAGLRAAADVVGADALVAARHRLEHVEMPSDDDIKTLADLGVVASVQPAFDAAWGAEGALYELRLGPRRAAAMNPFGRMLRAGVALAFGSDSPVTPIDPWASVRAATLHHAEDERLSPAEALDAHTRGGQWASRRDTEGVLAPGQPATYAVWDVPGGITDGLPTLTPRGPLPVCVETVVEGAAVYSRHPQRTGGERP